MTIDFSLPVPQKLRPAERRRIAQYIRHRIDEGVSTDDIAASINIPARRVRRIAQRHVIELPPNNHTKRFAFRCPRRRALAVMALAAEAEVSVAVMLERIVGVVVGDGPERARRTLGKLAQPKRKKEVADR